MRVAFILLLSIVSSSLLAQTKEIAFKSHSGNMKHFNATINHSLFDHADGGYGLPAPTKINTIKLDSVFYVSDTVAVIVIREFQKSGLKLDEAEKLVKTSKDTLYGDALLAHKHSLDSIKSELAKLGYYSNPIQTVVFVGYDNKKPKEKPKEKQKQKSKEKDEDSQLNLEKQSNITPMVANDHDDNLPVDGKLVLMLGTILALSLFGGWVSWKFYQPRFQ